MPKLSKPKHEIIANALASGKSQAEAYRAAGYVYKPANASRLCRNPSIEARAREIISERTNSEAKAREIGIARAALTGEWIILRLKHVIDSSIRGLPVYDRNGDATGTFKPDLDAAINGLKLAAKIAGILVHRHEIDESGVFARMTDAELNRAFLEQVKALGLSERSLVEIRASVFSE
ncbi:hypothetical protein BRDID11004_78010 [Bradyrhizobium diazoefficiens]|uniref:Terminase small subunit n=1 Tax=Bradyrhizobium diazoefficiens TaxID=1355477 RepID=A0A810AM02_9BRAD|nr:hypothetical protein [Bradyrhizobium diazoefficiens]BBZ91071.1 hypothetical protein F07S3_09040 [Bradyrhizobium diazoefficiens]BCA09057.1 hypothetical protein BDHF08_09040 [Bradyrhizobium diazoefficiens]BCE53392.1 hypothetical protein XF5B_09040 [Bradyrhizobium diazoefficiens]BCE62111.1 hypothetical protein XF6B_09100 [Bradyrhizobium diazoefficiens]